MDIINVTDLLVFFLDAANAEICFLYFLAESIKQADVVLMGYPLMYQMSEAVSRNDLTIYEQVYCYLT